MILIRSGFGIAALAAGIVAGFILYRAPSQTARLGEEAYRLSRNGNSRGAIEIYSEQIRLHPDEYIFYLRRGMSQKRVGALKAAVADFDEALRRIPQPMTAKELGPRLFNSGLAETHVHNMAVELHTERADALEKIGDLGAALDDLDAAVALNTRSTVMHRRATLRLLTGQFEGAKADFDAVLDRGADPDAIFGRGLSRYLVADWSGAVGDFQRALRANPRSSTYALWLLKAQLRARQPVPLDEFRGIPSNNPAWAWINAFLGDYDCGSLVNGLRNAAGTDPARVCDATYLLGDWFLIKNSPEEAAMAFRAAGEVCTQLTVQRVAAALELKRLEEPTPAVRRR
jgi:tetratricopeptide (TPR) repeat protein